MKQITTIRITYLIGIGNFLIGILPNSKTITSVTNQTYQLLPNIPITRKIPKQESHRISTKDTYTSKDNNPKYYYDQKISKIGNFKNRERKTEDMKMSPTL